MKPASAIRSTSAAFRAEFRASEETDSCPSLWCRKTGYWYGSSASARASSGASGPVSGHQHDLIGAIGWHAEHNRLGASAMLDPRSGLEWRHGSAQAWWVADQTSNGFTCWRVHGWCSRVGGTRVANAGRSAPAEIAALTQLLRGAGHTPRRDPGLGGIRTTGPGDAGNRGVILRRPAWAVASGAGPSVLALPGGPEKLDYHSRPIHPTFNSVRETGIAWHISSLDRRAARCARPAPGAPVGLTAREAGGRSVRPGAWRHIQANSSILVLLPPGARGCQRASRLLVFFLPRDTDGCEGMP